MINEIYDRCTMTVDQQAETLAARIARLHNPADVKEVTIIPNSEYEGIQYYDIPRLNLPFISVDVINLACAKLGTVTVHIVGKHESKTVNFKTEG